MSAEGIGLLSTKSSDPAANSCSVQRLTQRRKKGVDNEGDLVEE
jgi:hypothetical protein